MIDKEVIHVLSRAVVIDVEHILLCKMLKDDQYIYFLPGGHVDNGESAKSALKREILEEAGVDSCNITRFLGCFEFHPSDIFCHNHEYSLIFEVESAALKFNNPIPKLEEHIELVWIPIKEINNIDFRPKSLRSVMFEWLKDDLNKAFGYVVN